MRRLIFVPTLLALFFLTTLAWAESGQVESRTTTLTPSGKVKSPLLSSAPEMTTEMRELLRKSAGIVPPPLPPVPIDPSVPFESIGPTNAPTTFERIQKLSPKGMTPALDPGDFIFWENHLLDDTETNDNTSRVDEPSVGMNGRVVFYTGNWYAAVSGDYGKTFSYINPYDNFPADGNLDPVNGGFCCDQVTYYDESRDALFWLLQYSRGGGTNTQRIAVASSADDVLNNTWTLYDLTPGDFGFPATGFWLDFPDLSVSDDNLYHTTNVFLTPVNGTAQGTQSGTTLQDVSANWGVNQYAGYTLTLRPNTGSQEAFSILSNTSNTITISGVWTSNPSNGDPYTIDGYTATVIARYPLDQLASGSGVSGSYWVANRSSVRCTHGARGTMYFGAHNSNTSLRVFRWPDGSPTISWDDVGHAAYTTGVQMDATGPDGRDFAEFADNRLMGAWVANGVIGFMWQAAQGGGFAYPQTWILRVRESDRAFLSDGQIYNDNYAFMYPSVHPNDRGDLGGTIAFGGGAENPGASAWIADSYDPNTVVDGGTDGISGNTFVQGDSGPTPNSAGLGRWGDYLTTRQHVPYGNTWGGTGYALVGGPDNEDVEPHYVWFGRRADTPCILQLAVAEDELDYTVDPPDPWNQEQVAIDYIHITAEQDLHDLRFSVDPLQCPDVPCEDNELKKIRGDMVEFVPSSISLLRTGEEAEVEVKVTVPIGQHACTYAGNIHVVADVDNDCQTVSDDVALNVEVTPVVDMDIDNNGGALSNNTMYLVGAKGDFVQGTFLIVNPNSWDQNVDFEDGPGNIRIEYEDHYHTGLVKVGDDFVNISDALNFTAFPSELGSGEAAEVSVQILIPDDPELPVNATYRTRVVVTYNICGDDDAPSDIDSFNVELHVQPTQGTLDIVQTDISGDFCPPNPWTQVGQVAFSFDVHANGDHRNIRVASGGLKHDTLPKKLDEFNFFPEEIAFLAAGETRTINVITKIPIGQHSGAYSDYFRVVSENGGEDSVMATIEICPVFDLDVLDDYGNLSANVMTIQAISRANQSGGEWALRAFDVGIPEAPVDNGDKYDGPGNSPVDCMAWQFAPWSPMWHESDPSHNFYSNFEFFGVGSVMGDLCDWRAGQFKRMLVGLYVPPIIGHENQPGTYKGRLDCFAVSSGDTVASDFFDIEVHLARIVGPAYTLPDDPKFGGIATLTGAEIYWGDFTSVGLTGPVNLYRQHGPSAEYVLLNSQPLPQVSRYVDPGLAPGDTYRYKLGVTEGDRELLIGPLAVGGTPRTFLLSQNAPNPFGDQTTIAYQLPKDGRTTLKVFDLNGRLVRVLKDTEEPAGFYSVSWNRRDSGSRQVAAGIYFYRLESSGFTATKKMLVVDR